MFFANYELLIQDYFSCLTYRSLVSSRTNHVVFLSTLRNLNQYQIGPIGICSSVDPISQVCLSAMLVLPIFRKFKTMFLWSTLML
jgi:hypothetical protein